MGGVIDNYNYNKKTGITPTPQQWATTSPKKDEEEEGGGGGGGASTLNWGSVSSDPWGGGLKKSSLFENTVNPTLGPPAPTKMTPKKWDSSLTDNGISQDLSRWSVAGNVPVYGPPTPEQPAKTIDWGNGLNDNGLNNSLFGNSQVYGPPAPKANARQVLQSFGPDNTASAAQSSTVLEPANDWTNAGNITEPSQSQPIMEQQQGRAFASVAQLSPATLSPAYNAWAPDYQQVITIPQDNTWNSEYYSAGSGVSPDTYLRQQASIQNIARNAAPAMTPDELRASHGVDLALQQPAASTSTQNNGKQLPFKEGGYALEEVSNPSAGQYKTGYDYTNNQGTNMQGAPFSNRTTLPTIAGYYIQNGRYYPIDLAKVAAQKKSYNGGGGGGWGRGSGSGGQRWQDALGNMNWKI